MEKDEKFRNECFKRFDEESLYSIPLYKMDEIFIDWLESELEEARAKAETYKQLNQPPSFPYEYELFLVYFQRNQGDFRKTVHALTFDGRCSLEVMQWFALRLGISWEPEWR